MGYLKEEDRHKLSVFTAYCCEMQYEILCGWTTVKRECIVALPWQHCTDLCCSQPHIHYINIKGRYCCVATVTVVTRTSHNVMSCINFQSRYKTKCECNIRLHGGPRYLSRYNESLRAGRYGDRIPVWARLSASVQTDPGAHPVPYTMGTESFPGVKRPGRVVDHPPPI